jgi:hypothetical protein
MSQFHEVQGEVRQRCHGFWSGVLALAVLVLPLTGCQSGPCVSSLQCAEGYICVTFDTGSHYEQGCAKPCAVEEDFCGDGSRCYCPDSPAKTRCFDESGDRIGICGG